LNGYSDEIGECRPSFHKPEADTIAQPSWVVCGACGPDHAARSHVEQQELAFP
jgi:hypothetical protein